MCGICGVLNLDPRGSVSEPLVARMTEVLSHRGPDDDGIYLQGPVGLGHRRLSIIDLASGQQPMTNADATVTIVFNGEIYNFRSLRKELEEKGRRFRTESDTEVILSAYETYGEQCVEHLRGMFAFAIWDKRKRRLLLARDRAGIKPLHYCVNDGRLLFGSEIKSILQDPSVPRDVDPLAVDDYLTYLYVPAPKTIFRKIRKLRPGHVLVVSEDGIRETEYWDLAFEADDGLDLSQHSERLLETLRESVSAHMISDVPLGAFLSGGIDSSAVVGIMAGIADRPVITASIGFRESAFDELPYARKIARKFGTDSYEKTVSPDAAQILDSLIWYFDEPFADSSMIPTYYVSQIARERVTVSLSGDGGDENFGGYRRYRFDVLENRLRGLLPRRIRQPLFGALGRIYPKADWLPQVFRAKTLFTNLSLSPERAYFHTMSWFTPAMKSRLYLTRLKKDLEGYDSFGVLQEHFKKTEGWDPLSRIQYVDIKTYLTDDILTKVDRASMAHSLEVRVPLLDHKVMECAARIPARHKLRGGEGKYILKKALDGMIPEDVLYRRKMGFSVPLARWLRRDLKPMFEDRVFSKDAFIAGLFDIDPIRTWWSQHQSGIRDYSHFLWALLVLECWGKRFVERDSSGGGV